MDYLIRLAQAHESFRIPELETLATQENVRLEILFYQQDSPFCVVRLHPPPTSERSLEDTAKSFISRSILARGIYELWGQGRTYEELHQDIQTRSVKLWPQYEQVSFKFTIDAYCGKRSMTQQRDIINSFRYLAFKGRILLKNPDVTFVVFEEWEEHRDISQDFSKTRVPQSNGYTEESRPKRLFFGRYLGGTRRHLIEKHDLKKRPYISTTSMDAELALLTANLALAAPGKIFLDPFVGTGGFMVAASELGALTFGSDIDGRSYRGKGSGIEKGVAANFQKYGLNSRFGDCFTSDLTNTPLRHQLRPGNSSDHWLDGIIADPPYGIREGLKVLGKPSKIPADINTDKEGDDSGTKNPIQARSPHLIDGVPAYTLPDYVAPKRQYSLTRMLDDILDFAARTLVDGGRLAFWMPSVNELDQELMLPQHPLLDLKHVCIQVFNKWSRRLLVYEKVKGDVTDTVEGAAEAGIKNLNLGGNANDLNPFRKMYFEASQN